MPLARPSLFRLPISSHSEGGIRRRRHLLEYFNAAMELAHPAGAESLAPQPSQLASAVASTKKSLLANLRNLDGRAQPSPNAIPVARKINKMLKTLRYRRKLLVQRMAGSATGRGWSKASSQPPPHTTGQLVGPTRLAGECVYFAAKRQMSVNARKFGSHFGRIQPENVVGH